MSIGGYGIRSAPAAVDRRPPRGYRGRMRIRIGHELVFEVPRPTAMLLMLYAHPDAAAALEQPERLAVEPDTPVEDFVDWFGNRAGRLIAPAGTLRLRYDNVASDSGRRPRKGIVVVTPSSTKLSSAVCMRLTASGLSRPWQMSLPSRES